MRKENNYDHFGIKAKSGLSEYLANLVELDTILYETNLPNLFIIPSGGIPPNPAELLIGGKLDYLLDELRSRFDFIIIDTPPVGIMADALELAEKCDAGLFITKQNYTEKHLVEEAEELFSRRKLKNIGIILNQVDFKKHKSYNYYKNYQKKRPLSKSVSDFINLNAN